MNMSCPFSASQNSFKTLTTKPLTVVFAMNLNIKVIKTQQNHQMTSTCDKSHLSEVNDHLMLKTEPKLSVIEC